MPLDSHQEFLELCALSTTGELTPTEWLRLNGHLVQCEQCREAKLEYEKVVSETIPEWAAEAGVEDHSDSTGAWSIEQAEADLVEALEREPSCAKEKSEAKPKSAEWKHPRLLAVAALLLMTCSTTAYQIGVHQGHKPEIASLHAASPGPVSRAAPLPVPAASASLPALESKSPPDDEELARLRTETRMNQSELARLREQDGNLENQLADTSAQLRRAVEERSDLSQQLTQAQGDAQSLQAKVNQTNARTALDTEQALAANRQVEALKSMLAEKERQIALDQNLLEHDRDIRNLMGARNLYIAEIYDVAKTGDTQKPFGRMFYTKDKSLVFYGYDLDQQKGVQQASTFQAWGRSGTDRRHDISLGLLYQDDANQERWVLKFNDPKTISQIDAVFVTVEPHGGSAKPSGKPLLFAYLRLDPNHP